MDDPQHQKGRRHAEAHRVAQAVELRPEFARLLGPAGHAAVEHVEQHGQKDQHGRQEQVVLAGRVGADLGRERDGPETASRVPQRQQRGEDGEHLGPLHELPTPPGETG